MMTGIEAIKKFFGADRPVSTKELTELKKGDPGGYHEIATACLEALGEGK